MITGQPNEAIRWRLFIPAPRPAVYDLLRSDSGRRRFWAEETVEQDGAIEFRFPNGMSTRERILHEAPNEEFGLTYFGSRVTFRLIDAGEACELEVVDEGVAPAHRTEVAAGWVSVLMALKACAGHGIDLRNHDPERTWENGYVDN